MPHRPTPHSQQLQKQAPLPARFCFSPPLARGPRFSAWAVCAQAHPQHKPNPVECSPCNQQPKGRARAGGLRHGAVRRPQPATARLAAAAADHGARAGCAAPTPPPPLINLPLCSWVWRLLVAPLPDHPPSVKCSPPTALAAMSGRETELKKLKARRSGASRRSMSGGGAGGRGPLQPAHPRDQQPEQRTMPRAARPGALLRGPAATADRRFPPLPPSCALAGG